jgi:hypothetical protein
VFSLKERDYREQKDQQFLDQLHCALIEFALFDAIDELLGLGRISGEDVIVIFHRRRSRRSYAKQERTPRRSINIFFVYEGSLQTRDVNTADTTLIGVRSGQ